MNRKIIHKEISPQTNGMVERFNGRIEEVLQSHHFRIGQEWRSDNESCAYVYHFTHQILQFSGQF